MMRKDEKTAVVSVMHCRQQRLWEHKSFAWWVSVYDAKIRQLDTFIYYEPLDRLLNMSSFKAFNIADREMFLSNLQDACKSFGKVKMHQKWAGPIMLSFRPGRAKICPHDKIGHFKLVPPQDHEILKFWKETYYDLKTSRRISQKF